jgi:hypothetical protein
MKTFLIKYIVMFVTLPYKIWPVTFYDLLVRAKKPKAENGFHAAAISDLLISIASSLKQYVFLKPLPQADIE